MVCISDKRRGRGREGTGRGNNACGKRFLHECTRRANATLQTCSSSNDLNDLETTIKIICRLKQITWSGMRLTLAPRITCKCKTESVNRVICKCLANVFKYQVYLLACKCIRTGLQYGLSSIDLSWVEKNKKKQKHCPNCASSGCMRALLKISSIDYWIIQKCCVISWAENWTLWVLSSTLSKDFGEFSLKPLNIF